MRRARVVIFITVALLGVAGCSSESDAPKSSQEHVFEGQVEAIDKAREVETILERGEERKNQ